MDSTAYWVGFNKVIGIGPARLRALLDYFGDIEAAWHGDPADLEDAGLDRRSLANLLAARSSLNLAQEMERLEQAGVQVVTWQSEDYPANLRNIHDAPPLLYVKGTLLPEDDWAVAVVGTRRASVYGKEATRLLSAELARNGVTVVSGLAVGIDSVAHQAALEAGGRTIAVLGSGLDVIYPEQNRRLAEAIVQRGALITEYPLGTQPERSNFPPRNRIISGLSLGVVVVEAGARSGALITADFALEQGREVFAVPGSIFQKSCEGTNRLIQDGAKPVLSAADVLEELNLAQVAQQAEVRAAVPTTPTEKALLDLLSEEPVHVDELGRAADLPAATVASTLALLELKGLARQVGGMSYVLAREGRLEYRVE
ncbi:MAG: DNA-processing protein DprA [Caldilineales bacterium]|nr:DNA-processing protein DprA [Caldilineales bacterium]MDW8317411.1 DNA-processing protein DprA [Anaerolineae bacterium]